MISPTARHFSSPYFPQAICTPTGRPSTRSKSSVRQQSVRNTPFGGQSCQLTLVLVELVGGIPAPVVLPVLGNWLIQRFGDSRHWNRQGSPVQNIVHTRVPDVLVRLDPRPRFVSHPRRHWRYNCIEARVLPAAKVIGLELELVRVQLWKMLARILHRSLKG